MHHMVNLVLPINVVAEMSPLRLHTLREVQKRINEINIAKRSSPPSNHLIFGCLKEFELISFIRPAVRKTLNIKY